ncbi:MAG TPA: hypothetical protein DD379_03025 [Cyanobacteria bacterium UBA11162]|nr:hypothetical protein [Cyanobacteria bacterium UBA11162]
MNSSLKKPYLVLVLLLGSCFFIYFIISDPNSWIKSFSMEMASEIIGIFIVVFSIDRVIEIDQEKQRRKLESVAFLQLRRPLLRHFYLFFNMFKATITEKPDKVYQAVPDLFDNVFFEQLAFLDFDKSAPVLPSLEATWSDYLSKECVQFKDSLNRTMEKYCLFLQPEIIELMEDIINSPFLWLVFQAPAIRKFGGRQNTSGSYNLLARKEIRDLLREYTKLIAELFEQYNQRVSDEQKIKISADLWSNDILPKMGSGRI